MGNNVSEHLTIIQRDRSCGVLLGAAAGEALGSANRGEWGGGTARAIPVAELVVLGADLRREVMQDRVVERWESWRRTVGGGDRRASLLPVAPLALAGLGDEDERVGVVRSVAALTDGDPDFADAAVLWCAAIRHAVLTGELDIRAGLQLLESSRQQLWAKRFNDAEHRRTSVGAGGSGEWVALQCAWSTIVHTSVPDDDPANGAFRVDHLRHSVQAAVHDAGFGEEAAIVGGLLGAVYGASAVPADWRLTLRGWPGMRARGLIVLTAGIIGGSEPELRGGHLSTRDQIPGRRHPHDDQLWIGGVGPLARPLQYLPPGVDTIVSLCPVFNSYLHTGGLHFDVRLREGSGANANLDFVLLDTVRVLERLRANGRIAFVHSRLGTNRVPAVAALYGARRRGIGIDQALADVIDVLPDANPDDEFRAALHRLAGAA